MYSILRKVVRSVIERLADLTGYIRWKHAQTLELMFDKMHNVETSTPESAYLLSIKSKSVEFAIPYEPIQYDIFCRMMRSLSAQIQSFSDYVFIDLGSGKGRALLYAAHWRFASCIGVEFSRDLHLVAKRNISAYRLRKGRATAFELHCSDAIQYELPDANIVLFLYNPFTGDVMRSVVNKIERFIEEKHKDIVVLYRNPTCAALFDMRVLSCVESNLSYNIYRARRANAD